MTGLGGRILHLRRLGWALGLGLAAGTLGCGATGGTTGLAAAGRLAVPTAASPSALATQRQPKAPRARLSIFARRPVVTVSPRVIRVLLSITATGYRVRGRSHELSSEELGRIDRTIPRLGPRYDRIGLSEYLYQLKRQYPRSTAVNIYAAPNTPYATLVEAMEAAREHQVPGPRGRTRAELFSEIVFVSTNAP